MAEPIPVTRDDAIKAMRVYYEQPNGEPRYSDEEGALALIQLALTEDRKRVIERSQHA